MNYLWYDMDEVSDFHPEVEKCLKQAISILGLESELSVRHHPNILGSTTIPDFGILLKRNNQYVFILEVKRTRQSVESERFWIQTKGYVSALSNQWRANSQKYFAITNLEESILFADRDEHVNRCLLKGNPIIHGHFEKENNDNFLKIKKSFTESMVSILKSAYENIEPKFTDNWLLLVDSFYSTYQSILLDLKITDKIKKRDVSLYELLRFLFFYYLKSIYSSQNHQNSSVFRNINYTTDDVKEFVNSVVNSFERVLSIDFEQIFRPYGGIDGIIPDHITRNQLEELKRFIKKLDEYSMPAVSENSSPSIIFNLITEKIYSREELHGEGKVMTDKALACLLSELTILSPDSTVMDPGSGDGSLLDASYEKISSLYQEDNVKVKHNNILSKLHGCEIDSFLNQLATFRLVSKNLNDVNSDTQIDLQAGDVFGIAHPGEYDIVLMNPPFLRSDDPNNPITQSRKEYMLSKIEEVLPISFIREAKQPNLYFYFINWLFHYLKEDGRAGIVLMAKFLNNLDGVFIKEYLKEHIESIITYPKEYFSNFKITTCLVILQKNSPKKDINFLKIIKSSLIEDTQKVKSILEGKEEVNADFSLRRVSKKLLNSSDNWKSYLLDPKGNYEKIKNLKILKNIKGGLFSVVKRGSADNNGGSKTIFLNPNDTLSSFFDSLPAEYVGIGFQNNKLSSGKRRHFVVRENELSFEKAVLFPCNYDKLLEQTLSEEFKIFLEKAENLFSTSKWKRIVNGTFNSTVKADMLIPRAEREKHAVYIINNGSDVVVSTNFFYCSELIQQSVEKEKALKVIEAYLLSSFGQIQFELIANNQEGMLKLEGFMIDQLRSLDPEALQNDEIESIIETLDRFDNQDVDVRGDEGILTPRRDLDLSIASVIIKHEDLGFSTKEELVNFAELFLEELVTDRKP